MYKRAYGSFRFAIRFGLFTSGGDLCKRLHEILENIYGPENDHVFFAATHLDQGLVEFETGKIGTAKRLFEAAIDMLYRLFGDMCDNTDVADSMYYLGLFLARIEILSKRND